MYDIIETELSQMSKGLSIMGGFVVIYGLISFFVKERMYLSEPLLAVTVGIVIGPHVLNWVDPYSWADDTIINEITYEISRLVLLCKSFSPVLHCRKSICVANGRACRCFFSSL